MSFLSVPINNSEFDEYARKVLAIPMLCAEEEKELLDRWCTHKDIGAAQKLVEAYLKLVVKVVMGFKNYGICLMDLASEGNIGLMKAIKNFDPKVGCKIATYAVWWIKAAINEYVIRSWSMVKIGTTAAQRKLFFNLRKLKNSISDASKGNNQVLEEISEILSLPVQDVKDMDAVLARRDISLNAKFGEDNETEIHEVIESGEDNCETLLDRSQQREVKKELLQKALDSLDDRQREVFILRSLSTSPATLKDLSLKFEVSQERIRQIHVKALQKVREYIQKYGREVGI